MSEATRPALAFGDDRRSLVGTLLRAGAMPWLGRRAAYTAGAPVLSLAGAAATVAVPLLVDPVGFGDYILLLSVFQYACALDLGLSQLADRALARAQASGAEATLGDLVWARLLVALLAALAALPLCFLLARPDGYVTPVNLMIAVGGGLAFMLSNGPVTLYRAGSRVWEFTFAALAMQAGLSVPRLAGLVLGGVTGCFAALAAWFAATALLLNQPFAGVLATRPSPRRLADTLAAALPLFGFIAFWLVYLTANRWVAASLSGAVEFGLFAFGANLVQVGIGLVATVSQVHYPRHLLALGQAGAADRLAREVTLLAGAAMVGTLAGQVLCRFAIAPIFPHFAEAAATSAALMAAGLPLALAAWVMPLVIATSAKPWREGAALFGLALAALAGAMLAGNMLAGIQGQGWGCALAALVPLAAQLGLLGRGRLLARRQAWQVFALVCSGLAVHGLAWWLLFAPA